MKVRTDHKTHKLDELTFKDRFKQQFLDPKFSVMASEIDQLAHIAWSNYQESRKAPFTRKAGPEFKNPDYQLNIEWLKARDEIQKAQIQHEDATGPKRILIISASNRNDQTCPSEISKSSRMLKIAQDIFQNDSHIEVETLDLSLITSEYGKTIHPCKGCVSTAMPLCHWPCSCYPNQSLGQVHDWMNEIYPKWVRAHGIMIITPVYWHQAPSSLKLMIDRLVCADGGNTDPTSTHGKKAEEAKNLELKGWHYPRHLSGRMFSLVVHGDAAGVDHLKTSLTEWLEEMELIPVTNYGIIGRYIGYLGSYAESHEAFDKDHDLQKEIELAAQALLGSLTAARLHQFDSLNPDLKAPRPK